MFWIVSLVLVCIAALFVLYPLWRQLRPIMTEQRLQTNIVIFEERRNELDAELANGNLDQAQYAALLTELKKSLLRDTESQAQTKGKGSGRTQKADAGFMSRAVPILLVLMIPLLAFLLYGFWGKYDDVRLMDLYERSIASGDNQEEIRALVVELGEVVQLDSDNAWAWYFLGRNFFSLNMFEPAQTAYQYASELLPEGPDKAAALGQYAQVMYINSGGELTDEVMAIVERARLLNPSEGTSLQLLAFDAEMRQDYETAIGYWRLLIQANPNSSFARQLRTRIAEAQQLLAQASDADGDAGPRVDVSVSLAEGLELPEDLRVFVAARNADRQNAPPLAAIDLVVGDLPVTVTLDNNMAVTPMANLSSAETIYVSATVSLSGSATVGAGDYRVVSRNFAHNGQHAVIELIIEDRVQ